MNVTINRPGALKIEPGYATSDGRAQVYVEERGDPHAVLLWVSPEVAAQWIEALTPLAAGIHQ